MEEWSNIPLMVFLMIFKLSKCYQIAQDITYWSEGGTTLWRFCLTELSELIITGYRFLHSIAMAEKSF